MRPFKFAPIVASLACSGECLVNLGSCLEDQANVLQDMVIEWRDLSQIDCAD